MRKVHLLLLLVCVVIFQRSHAQVSQHFIGEPVTHETIRDIAYLQNGNIVSVGQRSVSVDGTNADALIFVKDNNNNIVWSRSFGTPNVEDGLSKVIVANNGDIVAIGRSDSAGRARGFICRYSAVGTLQWARTYHANPHTTHGEMFMGICQNPTTDALYICGGTNFAQNTADAMAMSVDFANGNPLWRRHYHITGTRPDNTPDTPNLDASDALVSIAFFNNRLYTLGYFQRNYTDDFYDLNVLSLSTTGIEQWRRRINLNVQSGTGAMIDNAFPQEIQINNAGRYLISAVVANDHAVSQSSVSVVLGGTLSAANMNITHSRSYRCTEFLFDNICKVLPTDGTFTNFLLAQMPGTSNFSSATNFSLNNITDARISQITNFDQIDWTREFVHAGVQGIYALARSGNNIAIGGSSWGVPTQLDASRDAFLVEASLPIAATDSFECGVINRQNEVRTYTFTPQVEQWISTDLPMVSSPVVSQTPNLSVAGACSCVDAQTTALDGDTIKTNTILHGRYYVTGTLTVAGNVTLDITNVDMSFGPCAGINVLPGGHIRANNSVFRPCDEHDVWHGITMTDSRENIFDECVFKNAETALDVTQKSTARINNNYFQNCQYGILFSNTNSAFPVSGNNFVHDYLFDELFFACTSENPGQSTAIQITASRITSDISHNDFMSSAKTPYIGVVVTTFGYLASLSQNNFTNMVNACVYSGPSFIVAPTSEMRIESNNIENKTREFGSQILISRITSRVTIVNNSLYASELTHDKDVYGIEILASGRAYVQNNTINGYTAAIAANSAVRTDLNDNKIFNSQSVGILLRESRQMEVRCNQIDMNHRLGTTGIYADGATSDVNIFTNCINNCPVSIQLEDPVANMQIYNNSLYNYTIAGVYNNSANTLDIGQPGQDGQNTFWSNSSSAFDIFTSPIGNTNVTNNFGVFSFNFPYTSLLAANPSHSTASCAHQIFNMPSQGNYNPMYDCDHLAEFLKEPEEAYADTKAGGYDIGLMTYYLSYFYSSSKGRADQYYQYLQQDKDASAYSKTMAGVVYARIMEDKAGALTMLAGIQPTNQQQAAEVFLQRLAADNTLADRVTALSEADRAFLRGYKYTADPKLDDIYVLMNLNHIFKELHYTPLNQKPLADMSSAIKVSTKENSLTVYPNPAHDQLNLRISSDDQATGKTLVIYNMLGAEMMRKDLELVAGSATLNVSGLATGHYIAVIRGGNTTTQARFSKK